MLEAHRRGVGGAQKGVEEVVHGKGVLMAAIGVQRGTRQQKRAKGMRRVVQETVWQAWRKGCGMCTGGGVEGLWEAV